MFQPNLKKYKEKLISCKNKFKKKIIKLQKQKRKEANYNRKEILLNQHIDKSLINPKIK